MPEKTEEKLVLEGKPLSYLGKPLTTPDKPHYKPSSFTIVSTSMQSGVEANYYWTLDVMGKRGPYGFDLKMEKIKDLYTAGITSTMWGSVEQRKAIQQEKAMNYLATIGKMTKDSFQIVRELRIIDERLTYYYESEFKDKKGKPISIEIKNTKEARETAQSAEIALKGTWVDMVEGGAKNPASVYGLATQVGFAVLPDLFFRISPKNRKEIAKSLEQARTLGVNEKVIEVLSRKLFQYLVWKEKTCAEIKQRRNFVLKYLRQHYNVIKLYMNWLRPYLANVRELQMKGATGPELAKAFETSRIELELIGIKEKYTTKTPEGYVESHDFKKYFPAVRVKLTFTAMPHMAFQAEGQRAPIHLGKSEMIFQGYVVTKKDIEDYKKKKDEEDFELIASLTEAMEALGEEFFVYLREAEEIIPEKKEEKKEEKKTPFFKELSEPFTSIISGMRSIVGLEKKEEKEGELTISPAKARREEKTAAKLSSKLAFTIYDVYKKAHGMMTPA